MTAKRGAVFLDRDGTINEQMGYINHLTRFQLLPGVGQAIKRLNQAQWPVVVVSNQSGVARGYFPPDLVGKVHHLMAEMLERDGARLDGVYYCPHHPRAELDDFRQECNCRKPRTGLFEQAASDLGLDLSKSYVIGDRTSDLKAGRNIGAKNILVLTGYGRGELEYVLPNKDVTPDFVAETLNHAVDYILADDR
jgi:D-glycero-D-manno-heptose 1,7-bisphosphate phosphatase